MAVNDVYRLSVDYTLASQVTSPVSGKTAFIPKMQVVTASGAVGPSTGAVTSVESTTVSGTILAANAARHGAVIFNTDANALYLLLAAGTASSTNLSVSVASNSSYEVPFGYTGIIVGVWAADGAGAAKVTEFT